MRKQTFNQAMLAFMAGAAMMSACVDDKYDLSDLDTTIQVGSSEMKLPKCSTGDIVLKNIFEIDPDDAIKEVTGANGQQLYYLDKDGAANPTEINIAEISIEAPAINGFTATLPRQEQEQTGQVKRNHVLAGDIAISAEEIEEQIVAFLNQHPATFVYDFEEKANFSYNGKSSGNINSDVLRIDSVDFKQGLGISYDVSVQDYGRLKSVHLDGLALELPFGFNIDHATFEETNSAGNIVRKIEGALSKTDGGRTLITFFKGKDETGFNLDNKLNIHIPIAGAVINPQSLIHFDKEEGKAGIARILAGNIQLHGCLRVTEKDINTQAPDMALLNTIMEEGNINALLPLNIKFHGEGAFEDGTNNQQKKIAIKTFSGSIEHEIESVNDIDLTDRPDFLNDEDVFLDLANPQLFLTVNCDIPTIIESGIALTAIRKNVADAANSVITTITYDGTKGEQMIALAEDITNIEWPQGATAERQTQKVENLKQLIRKIPDRIHITGRNNSEKIKVELRECKDIELGRSYQVGLQYRIYSKLTFGKDFKIVYSDTEDGMDLGDDLDDINDVKSVKLTGIAKTDIPLDLNLTINPLRKGNDDPEKRIIKDLVVEYQNGHAGFQRDGITIRANADGTQESDRFTIKITAASGHSLKEFLHSGNMQLDGIKYKAVLSNQSASTEALSPNASVKLQDIQVSVTGVSYLVNDDNDK